MQVRLGLALCLTALAIITAAALNAGAAERDSWQSGLPDWWGDADKCAFNGSDTAVGEVPEERVLVVPSEQFLPALERLESAPLYTLNEQELAALFRDDVPNIDTLVASSVERLRQEGKTGLADRQVEIKSSLKPYLVRSVVVNMGTGSYGVCFYEDNLVIRHDSLGHGFDHKTPLVIFLDRRPKMLFVFASSAL